MIPPSLIARYRCYGGDNSATDRNVFKDLSGNGNDITLNNFAWTEQSGYDKTTHKGALVFDGVDDYGLCDTFHLPNVEEDGFTVIALRKWIGDTENSVFLSTADPTGIFLMETSGNCMVGGDLISINSGTTFPENFCVYMTDETYNGEKDLVVQDPIYATSYNLSIGAQVLNLGESEPSKFSNIALYALEIYSRRLSEDEINRVKDRLMEEYLRETNCLDGLEYVAEWQTYGKTNTDEDRDVLKDLSGNGHDIQLYNLDYTEQSGYNTADYKGALVTDGVDDYGRTVNAIDDEVGTMICRAVPLTESNTDSEYYVETRNYNAYNPDGRLFWWRNKADAYIIGLGNELKNSATPPYGCLSREPQDMTGMNIDISQSNGLYTQMAFYHSILIRQKCTVEQVECLKWLMDKKYRDYIKNN